MYVAEGMLFQLSQVRYKNSTADNTTDDAVITVLEDPKWVDYELKSTTANMHLRIRVDHELGRIRRIHVVEEQTPVQTIKTLRYEVKLLGRILEEEKKKFDIAPLKSNIENRIRKINDAIRKTEKAACDRQHGEWDEEKGQCFFNADGLPLEEPLTGDIIIDPDTGPYYYKHAALVIEKNRSPAQQTDSTDPNNPQFNIFHRNVAVGADMGFDNKGKHQAGFTVWYYHSGVPSTGKVIFRFKPSPEKETAQDAHVLAALPPVESFYPIASEVFVRMLRYLRNNQKPQNARRFGLALLKVATPLLCKPGTLKDLERDAACMTSECCKDTPDMFMCSRFVIRAYQIALYQWLRRSRSYEDEDTRKRAITLLFPLSQRTCAPRHIEYHLKQCVHWQVLPVVATRHRGVSAEDYLLKRFRKQKCEPPLSLS